MAWSYDIPDGVPVDDDGIPRHPERDFAVCGYPKTDAEDPNGRKREDIDACLLAAGWGTDRNTGACRNHHGGSPGALEGWANGNARHLMYSERMNEDDKEIYETVVRDGDGNLLTVEDMADMLKTTIGWEYTRLVRAVEHTPGSELVTQYSCPECGNTYTHSETSPLPNYCTGHDMSGGFPEPCETPKQRFTPTGERYVTFGDKAVERKEAHLANLIETYKKIAEGEDINIDGSHDHTIESGDEPVDISITHAGVDLPDSKTVHPDDEATED